MGRAARTSDTRLCAIQILLRGQFCTATTAGAAVAMHTARPPNANLNGASAFPPTSQAARVQQHRRIWATAMPRSRCPTTARRFRRSRRPASGALTARPPRRRAPHPRTTVRVKFRWRLMLKIRSTMEVRIGAVVCTESAVRARALVSLRQQLDGDLG